MESDNDFYFWVGVVCFIMMFIILVRWLIAQ